MNTMSSTATQETSCYNFDYVMKEESKGWRSRGIRRGNYFKLGAEKVSGISAGIWRTGESSSTESKVSTSKHENIEEGEL